MANDPLAEALAEVVPAEVLPAEDGATVEVAAADAGMRTGSADLKEAPPAEAVSWPAPPVAPPVAPPAARTAARVAATAAPVRRNVVPEAVPRGGMAGTEAAAPGGPAQDGVASGAGGEADARDVVAWQAALSAWISRHQTYPQAARHLHTEGVVQVRFVLDAGGRVTSVVVARESGSEALDEAALALLRGAQLPPPPARLSADRRVVTVPIRYRLQ